MARLPDIVPVKRLLTPQAAGALLATKPDVYRNMRPLWVKFLAEQIKRGNWQCTTDAIGVDEFGHLGNGQHRLAAMVMAGVPCEVLFIQGLPKQSFLVGDIGVRRTVADSLHVLPQTAADITLVAAIMGKLVSNRASYTDLSSILGWWSPLVDDFNVNLLKASPGIANAATRVGIIVRGSVHGADAEALEYVRAQAQAFVGNDVKSMSTAVATAWQRCSKSGTPSWGSRTEKLARTALIYHCFNPDRPDIVPKVAVVENILKEVRAWLLEMHEGATKAAEKEVAKQAQVVAPPARTKKAQWVQMREGLRAS